MTRRDLRTLFRSNSPDLSAEEVFSDREDEWEAIARSVTACVAGMSDPGFDVEDFEEPRRNVLMFYGVGGIGKTSLSHNAAEKLAGGEGDRITGRRFSISPRACCRYGSTCPDRPERTSRR